MSRDHDRPSASPTAADHADASAGKRTLTEKMVRRAQRKNPQMQKRLRFDQAPFGSAPLDSPQFAYDVAERQAAAGVEVDGVVGPGTLRAMGIRDPFDFLDGPSGGKRGGMHRSVGEISHRQELPEGGTRIVTVIGRAERVVPQTRWSLCNADGTPLPGGDLRPVTFGEQATSLTSHLSADQIPAGIYVLASTPEAYLPPLPSPDEPLDMTGLED